MKPSFLFSSGAWTGALIAAFVLPALNLHAASGVWSVNGNGSWNANGNWTPNTGFPNANDQTATFSQGSFSGVRQINTGQNITINRIIGSGNALWEINNNTITLAGTTPTVGVSGSTVITINSILAGTGGFTKLSGGTVILAGNNTLSGTILLTAGTIVAAHNNALGTSSVNITNPTSSSALAFQGGISVGNAITLNHTIPVDGTVRLTNLSGNNTLTNTLTVSGVAGSAPIIQSDAGNLTFAGNIVGDAPALHFTGAGTKTIAGSANTYSGQTHVLGGTLVVTGSNSGAGSHTIASGAKLQVGNNTATGNLGSGSIANAGTLEIRRNNALSLANAITGAGTVIQNGSGTTTLSADNAYSGQTQVLAGTLVVTGENSGAGSHTIASGAKLQVGNNTATGNLGSGSIANAGTLEIRRNNALSLANAITGAGTVIQNGSGTTTLSTVQAYTGATQVNVGTLLVNGSIASSSGVTVAAGATLGGSGTVSAISGAGTIAPGNSPGILTALSVDGSAGTDFSFEITSLVPAYDQPATSLNDVLRLTAATPFVTDLDGDNTITVDFSNVTVPLAIGQVYYGGFYTNAGDFWDAIEGAQFVFVGTSGFQIVVSTAQQPFGSEPGPGGYITQFSVLAIPEPSATVLLTVGLTTVLLLRRRAKL